MIDLLVVLYAAGVLALLLVFIFVALDELAERRKPRGDGFNLRFERKPDHARRR